MKAAIAKRARRRRPGARQERLGPADPGEAGPRRARPLRHGPGRLPARVPDGARRPPGGRLLGGRAASSTWCSGCPRPTRDDVEKIRKLRVPVDGGAHRPARRRWRDVQTGVGRARINRENGRRYIGIRMNVRGRDMGGFVNEARDRVEREAPLRQGHDHRVGRRVREQGARDGPPGHGGAGGAAASRWCCSSRRSTRSRSAMLMLLNVPFALLGGVFGLWAFGMPLSRLGGGRLHRAHRPGVAERRAGALGHRRAAGAGRAARRGDPRRGAGNACGRC